MKAKKFKEIVSQIPDDDELIFTYSMFEFENAGGCFRGKEIAEYFENRNDDIPCSENTWMIKFDN